MTAVRVRVGQPRFTVQRIWVEMAEQNASLAITARRVALSRQEARLDALCRTLELDIEPDHEVRIECFDISHTQGESTVASCVVYQGGGMRKSRIPPLQHRRTSSPATTTRPSARPCSGATRSCLTGEGASRP
jgi:excinuclease UvrABC nuclease subunit